MNNITINILGCCVSRDAFDLIQNNYIVKQYVAAFAPLFINQKIKNDIINIDKLNKYNSKNATNFYKRCIYLDISKMVMEYINEHKANYLLIDIGTIRSNYIKFDNGITTYGDVLPIIKELKSNGIILSNYQILNFDYMSKEEFLIRTNEYCDEVLKLYNRNEIILNEVRQQVILFDKSNKCITKIKNFYEVERQNKIHDFVFNAMKNRLHGSHVIPMLNQIPLDKCHRWGMNPLHFTYSYYKYVIECIDIITKKYDINVEQEKIKTLHDKYLNIFRNTYYTYLCNAFINI